MKALTYRDDGSGGQVVVAARGGVIQHNDPGDSGGYFAVQVRQGANIFFDCYLHVDITTAKLAGETVKPGEAIATISTAAYGAGRRHLHQMLYDNWVGARGFAANGSNFMNPLSIFPVAADRDPLGAPPRLEDVDATARRSSTNGRTIPTSATA